jgi:hypothetical protein
MKIHWKKRIRFLVFGFVAMFVLCANFGQQAEAG